MFLLVVSLLAFGFLPDFQAEIKSVYKPQAYELMTITNKWVTIISSVFALLMSELLYTFTFMWDHWLFAYHLIMMGLLNTVGQMFVYRMIKQFKQHFVPFVITTRKLVSVGVSIIYFGHPTNAMQVIGIVLVFTLVTFEFAYELYTERQDEKRASPIEEHPPA